MVGINCSVPSVNWQVGKIIEDSLSSVEFRFFLGIRLISSGASEDHMVKLKPSCIGHFRSFEIGFYLLLSLLLDKEHACRKNLGLPKGINERSSLQFPV